MPGHMLHTAVIPVYGHPVFDLVMIRECLVVVGIHITKEIPGGSCPLGHGIGLSLRRAAALGAGAVDKFRDPGQRGLAVLTGLKVLDLRQAQRQFLIRNRHDAAVGAVDQRNGLAPVTLSVEGPVFHLVLDTGMADALFYQVFGHFGDGILLIGQAVEEAGVDHLAVAGIGFFLNVAAFDDFNNIDTEFMGKFPVTLVMGRHCHDRAGAVSHHDIVGDKDRDHLAVHGVDRFQSLNLETGLILDQLGTLELGLPGALLAVSLDGVHVGDTVRVFVDQRMLGRHDHKSNAKERVRPCGIDFDLLIYAVEGEVYKSAGGLADPVDLLQLDVLGIIHIIQALQQLFGIIGDPQIPDHLGQLDDIAVADIALTALAVLIGQNDLAVRAVIDQRLVPEYQTVLIELEEDPLGPVIIILIRCINGPVPVKGKPYFSELVREFLNIDIRDDTGMCIGLDRVILSGQTESVEADGKQDVIALHPPLSGDDFDTGIGFDMADVHARAAWIREFHQSVKFRLLTEVLCLEQLGIFPFLLPLGFYLLKIIVHK